MHPKPPRQHYISKFLIKQWADDNGEVGVVCLYHRDSAIVSHSGLHYARYLSSSEQEREWSCEESQAKGTLDRLTELLDPAGAGWTEAEAFLSEPKHFEALIDLVTLHHARSLGVPLQQVLNGGGDNSVETEAKIHERRRDVENYYSNGIQITVFDPDTPLTLGAIPVFDAQSWGGREPGTAQFMMPLTPRVLISGTSERPSKQVKVASSCVQHVDLVMWQLGGAPDLFSTPYLICEPSALERTRGTALELAEGGNWHWYALRSRIDICGASSTRKRDWRRRIRCQERNQRRHASLTTADPKKAKLRRRMASEARKIQTELDEFGAPVCACKQDRQNSNVSGVWKSVMPQIICDTVRQRRNPHDGASEAPMRASTSAPKQNTHPGTGLSDPSSGLGADDLRIQRRHGNESSWAILEHRAGE